LGESLPFLRFPFFGALSFTSKEGKKESKPHQDYVDMKREDDRQEFPQPSCWRTSEGRGGAERGIESLGNDWIHEVKNDGRECQSEELLCRLTYPISHR